MDDVGFGADGCDDGGGFGAPEEGQGGFGEHIGDGIQTAVVNGLADRGGGDHPVVGGMTAPDDAAPDAVGRQGFAEHVVIQGRHQGMRLMAHAADGDAQGLCDLHEEGRVKLGLGAEDLLLGFQKIAGEGRAADQIRAGLMYDDVRQIGNAIAD